ncbi:MAG: helix-turn-helix domain-containing protein [Bacteroidales bacterium]
MKNEELKKTFTLFDQSDLSEVYNKLDKIIEMLNCNFNDENKIDNLLKTNDVLKMLNICPKTLQKYRNENRITFSKVGKIIYYKKTDIDKFIDNNRRYRICA